jgi:hypothetical protein
VASQNRGIVSFQDIGTSRFGSFVAITYKSGAGTIWRHWASASGSAYDPFFLAGNTTTWIHWAFVGSSTTLKVYKNGALNTTNSSFSLLSTFIDKTFPYCYIGTVPTEGGTTTTFTNGFNGYIDDWRFYNQTMTDAQISAIYAGTM